MSFTTSGPQRRGYTSATVGISRNHVRQTSYPASDILRQPPGPTRAHVKRRRIASIGDDEATGLLIHGSHQFDPMEGRDPDTATPPLSSNTLANPDFPISYSGRGTMKFVSPIRITSIDGPLHVNGEIYSSSGLLLGGTVDDVANWTVTVGETGAGADLEVDAGNTWATYARTKDHVSLHVHYTWTGKGSVGAGSQIFIKGLPFDIESQVHKAIIHPTGIIATQMGSYFVADGQAGASEFAISSADSATGVEVPVTGTELSTSGTISLLFNYHAVIS